MYFDNRVNFEPVPAHAGKKETIIYQGLLMQSGADGVYLHYGYDGWQNVSTIPMTREKDGTFKAEIKPEGEREVNLCFKDSASNWDNNSGWNWKIDIV